MNYKEFLKVYLDVKLPFKELEKRIEKIHNIVYKSIIFNSETHIKKVIPDENPDKFFDQMNKRLETIDVHHNLYETFLQFDEKGNDFFLYNIKKNPKWMFWKNTYKVAIHFFGGVKLPNNNIDYSPLIPHIPSILTMTNYTHIRNLVDV